MSSNITVVTPPDMPVGLRFCPTEEEVINHYLKLKLQGKDSEVDPYIAEVDIYKSDPWELKGIYGCFFFFGFLGFES